MRQEEDPEEDAASTPFPFPGPPRVKSRGLGSRAIGADPLGYCRTQSRRGPQCSGRTAGVAVGEGRRLGLGTLGFQRCSGPLVARHGPGVVEATHSATPFTAARAYPKR